MVKLVLSVFFTAICTLVGYSASLRLKNRKECLQEFLGRVQRMKSLIRFSGYDIDRVINVCFSDLTGFERFEDSKTYEELYTRWTRAASVYVYESKLKFCDEAVIMRFGENLGVTDTEGQIMNCDLYCELLTELIEDASEEEKTKSKLYRVLGFSLGALITLLVL